MTQAAQKSQYQRTGSYSRSSKAGGNNQQNQDLPPLTHSLYQLLEGSADKEYIKGSFITSVGKEEFGPKENLIKVVIKNTLEPGTYYVAKRRDA